MRSFEIGERIMKISSIFLALCVCLAARTASASFILSLENVSVTAGSQAAVGVFIASLDGDSLVSFNLPVDVGNNGFGMPPGFSFASGDFAQEQNTFGNIIISGTTPLGGTLVQNYDAIFSDGGTFDILLTPTPRRLFNILIDTSSSLSLGTSIPISFNANSNPQLFNVTTRRILGGTVVIPTGSTNGSITITAIPEPASMLLLLTSGLGFFCFRKLKYLELAKG